MTHTSRNPLLHVGDRRWKVRGVTKDLNGMHIMGNLKNTHGAKATVFCWRYGLKPQDKSPSTVTTATQSSTQAAHSTLLLQNSVRRIYIS